LREGLDNFSSQNQTPRSSFQGEGDRFLTFQAQKSMIVINPTLDPEGNELTDPMMKEHSSRARLRGLLNGMTYAQKIAVAQIACNQMAGNPSNQLIS
jgi:hypothetical protein